MNSTCTDIVSTMLTFGIVQQQVWIHNVGTISTDFNASLLHNKEGMLETTLYIGSVWIKLNQCITFLNGQITYKGANHIEMSTNFPKLSNDDIEKIEAELDWVYYKNRGNKIYKISLRNDSQFKPTLQ